MMNLAARHFFSLGCIALTLLALPSCSSTVRGPGGKVTKAKVYNLQPTQRINGSDPAIHFERSYYLHGAVTLAEQMERAGQYYTFFWKVDDRSQPVTVRFEYRQAKTGMTVKKKELEIADVRRGNVTKFSVIGSEYSVDGAVTSWRVSLLRGKEELVHSDSYLWK